MEGNLSLAHFLSLLDGVRDSGNGQYVARCPHHDDKSPSLRVTEGGDGTILVHCFAGCSADMVCGAVGLSVTDLFPSSRGDDRARNVRVRGKSWETLCRSLLIEAGVLQIVISHVMDDLPSADLERVLLAEQRIEALRALVYQPQ